MWDIYMVATIAPGRDSNRDLNVLIDIVHIHPSSWGKVVITSPPPGERRVGQGEVKCIGISLVTTAPPLYFSSAGLGGGGGGCIKTPFPIRVQLSLPTQVENECS